MLQIKNNSSTMSHSWGGVQFAPLFTYTIQNQMEANKFLSDDNFICELSMGVAQVYRDNLLIPSVATSINSLTGVVLDTNGIPIVTNNAFSSSGGFRFRGASFSTDVATGVSGVFDYLITQERHINGGLLIVDNIGPNDKVTFRVVDVNNVLGYGPNVVLDEFIKDFYISQKNDLEISLPYPARINAGLYLRMIYTSTHASGAHIKCNLFLHWKQS